MGNGGIAYITSALNGIELSALCTGSFTPRGSVKTNV